MIFFNNITKQYENGTVALNDVSFFIDKGEFVFIVGSSGAGKSTITKLILCEEQPSEGTVLINGINLADLKHREMPFYRRQLGIVFQDFRLLPSKTVYENIAFAMQVRNASTKEIRRAIPGVLGLVNLSSKAKVKPGQLSGGEQQRVALARAMVNNPPVLIADEPTGNLDPSTAFEIIRLLEDFNKKGTTVLIVTHARDIVNKMQKRVIEIEDGKIIRDGVGGYNI